jgi:Lar family restriction alleviation protein
MSKVIKPLSKADLPSEQYKSDHDGFEPCPFCGARRYLSEIHLYRDAGGCYVVECGNCDAVGPSAASRQLAKNLWNERSVPRKGSFGIASMRPVKIIS